MSRNAKKEKRAIKQVYSYEALSCYLKALVAFKSMLWPFPQKNVVIMYFIRHTKNLSQISSLTLHWKANIVIFISPSTSYWPIYSVPSISSGVLGLSYSVLNCLCNRVMKKAFVFTNSTVIIVKREYDIFSENTSTL